MIDAGALIYGLLSAGLPGMTVGEDVNTGTINEFPYVVYNLAGAGQNDNGPSLWSYVLDVNVLDDTTTAFASTAAVYDLVHGWLSNPASGIIPGVGWVQNVTDISIFSPLDSPIVSGRTVSQYAGSFALSLRN